MVKETVKETVNELVKSTKFGNLSSGHSRAAAVHRMHRMHCLHVCLQDWRGMLQGEPVAKWWENPHEVVGKSFFLEFLHIVFNNVQSSCLFWVFLLI